MCIFFKWCHENIFSWLFFSHTADDEEAEHECFHEGNVCFAQGGSGVASAACTPMCGSCPLTTCFLPSQQLNWKRLVNRLWCKFRAFHAIAVCCFTGRSSSSLFPSRETGLWCGDKQGPMMFCLYLYFWFVGLFRGVCALKLCLLKR